MLAFKNRRQIEDRLLHMLAAVHGRMWNASRIGRGLGLSYHTVNSYVGYLAGTFLIPLNIGILSAC